MIFGVGTDIIEVERIEKMVAKGRQYLDTIFTKEEVKYCESKARRAEHYAARYAAKEAVLKALGVGWRDGFAFSDIEILNNELGQPYIFLRGKVRAFSDEHQITKTSVSLSHSKESAVAVIILEK
jgi:holo-[acyl-carrier protein] synthase